jgi:hypothetical protein
MLYGYKLFSTKFFNPASQGAIAGLGCHSTWYLPKVRWRDNMACCGWVCRDHSRIYVWWIRPSRM